MSFHRGTTGPAVTSYEGLTGAYTIDPLHSSVGFSVRHAMVTNVRGKFGAFEGLLRLDGADPARSEAHVSVQTASLDTGVGERDAHLKGPDFFDTAVFPVMAFSSTGITAVGDGRFRMSGDLRIKDVERPLDLDIRFGGSSKDADGRRRVGFEGTASLHRSEWGLTWNAALEAGGVLVGDKVTLLLDVSAVQADADAA
ncbi:YceI family protein [Streptomyces sp. NPDC013178]|uniref:YceI family protein n=1 Tax=Streptomyces sp. NPDC013178 TaxID=3155118 RepID=UPI003400B5EB